MSISVARRIRKRRMALGISRRSLGRSVGCSYAYLYQVETGLRPLSPELAPRVEAALRVRAGSLRLDTRRGRPPLGPGTRRVLKALRGARGARAGAVAGRVPAHPRPDWGKRDENPFWPMALHLGERAGQRVRQLEKVRRQDNKFWRLANSLRFDSWSEKALVVEVGLRCLELTGLSPKKVGCSLASACGQTGRDTGGRAYPAFVLEHRGASLAWFSQRCVATDRGFRWPDNLVVVARDGVRRTVVVELDGPRYHADVAAGERRDQELGVPVLHVHPDVLRTEEGVERILDWVVDRGGAEGDDDPTGN